MKNNTKYLVRAAAIAALYVVLTLLCTVLGLTSGPVQIRLSEGLCLLPFLYPEAVPGLFVGCILTNVICGEGIYDIIFGSLATLLGALGTRFFRKKKILGTLCPILSNTIIIPLMLVKFYHMDTALLPLMGLTLISEIITVGIIGNIIVKAVH